MSLQRDIGAAIKGVLARIPEVITAAAGNDNQAVDGPILDRLELDEGFHSVAVMIAWRAALDEGETLTLSGTLRDSANGTDFDDFGTALAATVVATGPSGGGNLEGVTVIKADISTARRYLRLRSTADLSRGGTDTVAISAVHVLGGADILPTT